MKEKANLFVVASPSGGGKTSLVKALINKLDKIEISISHTTRSKRPGEKHGQHYFFVNEDEFNLLKEQKAFIEHANVYGQLYGTSKEQITNRLSEGIDVLLDIDWQGARQIVDQFNNVVLIFIIPPSDKTLKDRLLSRKQDDDKTIDYRMEKAQAEMSHYQEFDYLIVNDSFEHALEEMATIIRAERLKTKVQSLKYQTLLSKLLMSK